MKCFTSRRLWESRPQSEGLAAWPCFQFSVVCYDGGCDPVLLRCHLSSPLQVVLQCSHRLTPYTTENLPLPVAAKKYTRPVGIVARLQRSDGGSCPSSTTQHWLQLFLFFFFFSALHHTLRGRQYFFMLRTILVYIGFCKCKYCIILWILLSTANTCWKYMKNKYYWTLVMDQKWEVRGLESAPEPQLLNLCNSAIH